MKSQQRHLLKQNEFAATVARVSDAVRENRSRVAIGALAGIVLVGGLGGFYFWRKHVRDEAGSAFASAMAIAQSPIAPAPTVPGAAQAAGTYPSVTARREAAVAAFQAVASQYPSSADGVAAAYQAAGELFALGRLAEAEQTYADVIDRAGASSIYGAAARMGLAETLTAEGQYDRAIQEYTDLAAQRDGVLPVDGILFQLAQTYAKAGKTSDARATFQRVVDEFPNSAYVADARQQMTLLG